MLYQYETSPGLSLQCTPPTVCATRLALLTLQALHLCAVVCPNYDFTFALAVVWTTIQQLFCSFYIRFSIVWVGSVTAWA